MGLMKRMFDFYLESSIHVALAVTALTILGYYSFGIPLQLSVLLFVFLGTITGYNLVKYAPIAGLYHRSLTRHLKGIQLFSFIIFFANLYYFFQIPELLRYISIGLAVCTLLYVIPFYGRNLRNRYGLKIFIVGWVWAGVTSLLPFFTTENSIEGDLVITFFQRFLWVVVLTLPFDIRDLVYDSKDLGTLPQRFGIAKTKAFGLGLLVLIVILEGFKDYLNLAYIASQLFILIISGILLLLARKEWHRYYTIFWIESLPLVWLGLYLFFDYLFIS